MRSIQVTYCLLLLALIAGVAKGQSPPQDTDGIENPVTTVQPVRLTGLVAAHQKYTVEIVDANSKTHPIRLSPETKITLRMNKPYFDWEAGKVFVEPIRLNQQGAEDTEPKTDAENAAPRVGVRIPGQRLFLIAGFKSEAHLKRTMQPAVKRINFYLITPESLPAHRPTSDELYISGKLQTSQETGQDQQVTLQVGEASHQIRLGFRTATMSGFSIADLKPSQTRVTVVGTRELNSKVITATTIAFEPVMLSAEK